MIYIAHLLSTMPAYFATASVSAADDARLPFQARYLQPATRRDITHQKCRLGAQPAQIIFNQRRDATF